MTTTITAAASWITNTDQCTLSTCPLSDAHTTYLPNLAGNSFYIALFALFIPVQLFLGIRSRTWGFMVGAICGLILEVLGYIARLKMRDNPFIDRWFVMYLVCLTIAPAFLSGAIYVSLARIVAVYTTELSRIKQRSYGLIFVAFDVLSLLLQAAGGAITTSNNASTVQVGINIMLAGLSLQVASLTLYLAICLDFAWRVYRHTSRNPSQIEDKANQPLEPPTKNPILNPDFALLRASKKWKAFLFLQGLATVCIYIRSVFRVAELSDGFQSHLANDEVTFMVLEGAMISIAVIGLGTWGHPAIGFDGYWDLLDYPIFKKRGDV